MIWKLINFLSLLTLSAIIRINSGNGGVLAVGYQTSDQSSKGGGYNSNNGNDMGSPANYMFEYGIDDHYGPTLSHQEERNGYQTRGRYSVLLPDGRLQVVTYRADKNGYNADVTYEPSQSGSYGHNSGNGGSGGFDKVQASASSYGQQPSSSSQNNNDGGYSGKGSASGSRGHGSLSGNRNSRSFVKFRRTDNGRTFNYAY